MATLKKYLTSGSVVWWLIVSAGAIVLVLLVAKRLYG